MGLEMDKDQSGHLEFCRMEDPREQVPSEPHSEDPRSLLMDIGTMVFFDLLFLFQYFSCSFFHILFLFLNHFWLDTLFLSSFFEV